MELIKGAPVSAKIKEEVGVMLEKINGPAPKLAIVRVGENPDDMSYERGAVKKMDAFGLRSQCYTFPADITDEDFKKEFTAINADTDVSGILLLRPLPKQICEKDIPEGWMGLDIGPKTVELFKKTLEGAKTVVWNGPMGVFEMEPFAKGTLAVCTAISELPGATTVIGGGDSAAAAIQLGFKEKFSHISTGGGASLEYMEGKELPGIAVISEK